MKQLLISASLVLFTTLVFTSCKKCQTCTSDIKVDVSGVITSSSASEEYCGDNYDNAPDEGSASVTVGSTTTTTSITCKKS